MNKQDKPEQVKQSYEEWLEGAALHIDNGVAKLLRKKDLPIGEFQKKFWYEQETDVLISSTCECYMPRHLGKQCKQCKHIKQ